MNGFSQLPPRSKYFRTIVNTVWIYPDADFQYVLANTNYKYSFDGTNLICPDIATLSGLYQEVYNRTAVTQPIGNPGYSLGVGTLLEEFGKSIYFKLADGQTVLQWRLAKQLTPQTPAPNNIIPTPGNSPAGTIGYLTVFISIKDGSQINSLGLDIPYVVRVG